MVCIAPPAPHGFTGVIYIQEQERVWPRRSHSGITSAPSVEMAYGLNMCILDLIFSFVKPLTPPKLPEVSFHLPFSLWRSLGRHWLRRGRTINVILIPPILASYTYSLFLKDLLLYKMLNTLFSHSVCFFQNF